MAMPPDIMTTLATIIIRITPGRAAAIMGRTTITIMLTSKLLMILMTSSKKMDSDEASQKGYSRLGDKPNSHTASK